MGPELILVGLLVAQSLLGWTVLRRLRRCRSPRDRQCARSLSIIIPARNEEANLPALLQSIQVQKITPLEVIVVNDHSTDRTADIARQHSACVIDAETLPSGWGGKTWACFQGATAARGELLLFMDADTRLDSDGLAQLLDTYPGSAWSLCPYHTVSRTYEMLSLFFNVNMAAATIPEGLFGQMLLVERQTYFAVGGHQSVKGHVLENYWLAQVLRGNGFATRSGLGRGMVSMRMYPNGIRELMGGWSKGFLNGAAKTPAMTMIALIAWMGALLTPFMLALTGELRWAIAAYVFCAVQVAWHSRHIGSFGWQGAVLYPVPQVFFFFIFVRALLIPHRTYSWKGRPVNAL